MNRRDFIGKSMAVAACGSFAGINVKAFETIKRGGFRIGIQLYSINKSLPTDVRGSLRKIADMGYEHVEAYGFNGSFFLDRTLKEWKLMLDELGMTLSGTHCGTPMLPTDVSSSEWDYWRKSAEEMRTAGGKYLVQSFLPARESLDEVKRVAEQFNKTGEICRLGGVRFGYHNHHAELKEVEGQVILDVLLQNTDPELVFFQMDMGHVVNGGGNILDYMRKYPKRFLSWHASDFKKGEGYVELGQGDVPYDELLQLAGEYGLMDLTVEQETGGDIYAACKRNFEFLKKFAWTKTGNKA
ncbi:MAG: sugar phosphate isomerase/epimerase [Tannerellaceae bacterium]|jgi:sugar phosphate isomerase/epimerase|nr:sugar phosphate isomerase/epimerase [Tannerellaceae bacterium]